MRKTVLFLGVVVVSAWIFLGKTESPAENTVLFEDVTAQESVCVYEEKNNNCYGYGRLNETEKTLYGILLEGLKSFSDQIEVEARNPEQLEKVFACVMADHPEMFYVSGYHYTDYTDGEKNAIMTLRGEYTHTKQEAEQLQGKIDVCVDRILSGIKPGATEYEKVKYVYDSVITGTEYDLHAPESQNICSVFLNHKSVCLGYAKATQYLLQQLGVDSFLVTGSVKKGESHAWNLVKVDGDWYYLDATWGDAYYRMEDGEVSDIQKEVVNYDYFCVTTKQLERTHTIKTVVSVPVCNATEANYYVAEGTYFSEYDENRIGQLFSKAKEEGKECLMLKCATDTVYDTMQEKLIEKRHIFRFLDCSQGKISYTNNAELRSLSFWL